MACFRRGDKLEGDFDVHRILNHACSSPTFAWSMLLRPLLARSTRGIRTIPLSYHTARITMSAPASAPPAAAETPAGPSKSELKKRAKEAEKEKKRIEREAREAQEKAAREAADVVRSIEKLASSQNIEGLLFL